MDQKLKLIASQVGDTRIQRQVDLSDHIQSTPTGLAEAFYIATTSSELIKIVTLAKELELNFLVIGSGSKITLVEPNFEGLLIKNRSDAIKIGGVKGKVSAQGIGVEEAIILADSGVSLSKINDFAKDHKLEQVPEFNSYPGTIGGNLYVFETVKLITQQVQVLTPEGEVEDKKLDELKQADIIIGVTLRLKSQSQL